MQTQDQKQKQDIGHVESGNMKINEVTGITSRMKGWQLETFKESYKYKLKNGISLVKKKLQEKN